MHAKQLMHGKTSPDPPRRQGRVRAACPIRFTATRYHSLAIERETLPDCLEITAWTDDGEIMGVRHKTLAVEGVQFHPESILTEHGHDLLHNFLKRTPEMITPQEALQRTIEHREIFHDEMLHADAADHERRDLAGDDRRASSPACA